MFSGGMIETIDLKWLNRWRVVKIYIAIDQIKHNNGLC